MSPARLLAVLRAHRSSLAGLAMSAGLLVSLAAAARAAGPGTDWIKLAPAQQPPRLAAMASAWDPASGRVVFFGGYDAIGYRNDTWSFDGATWSKLVTPVA